MRNLDLKPILIVLVAIASTVWAQNKRPDPPKERLVLASQGSFFVGGEDKTVNGGEITINQMYVQYQVPVNAAQHLPVVMVHGCCLSSKTWESTPDGRMGWNEYFLRKGRGVYLADQVSRARSGFDPSILFAVKAGKAPPSALPEIIAASHQVAWTV